MYKNVLSDLAKDNILLVVAGPTAVGKTSVAIRLAQHFNTVVVSADSRQFYQEMTIGTAPPSPTELSMVPHHFIQTHSIHKPLSVGEYERQCLALLEVLFEEHEVVILTGGSGLYLQSVTEGLDDFPEVPQAIRERTRQNFSDKGMEWLHSELQQLDPAFFAQADQHNHVRLLRALEVIRASGQPFSTFQKGQPSDRDFFLIYLQLACPREQLYQRINKRVDQMVDLGLEAEARELLPWRDLPPLKTVGYQEWWPYFDGTYDRATAIQLIQRNTRRYAKRQLTWWRRQSYWRYFEIADWDMMLEYIALVRKYRLVMHHQTAKDIEQIWWTIHELPDWVEVSTLTEQEESPFNEEDQKILERHTHHQVTTFHLTYAHNAH